MDPAVDRQPAGKGGVLERSKRNHKGIRSLPNSFPGLCVVIIRQAARLIEHLPPFTVRARGQSGGASRGSLFSTCPPQAWAMELNDDDSHRKLPTGGSQLTSPVAGHAKNDACVYRIVGFRVVGSSEHERPKKHRRSATKISDARHHKHDLSSVRT